MMMRSTMSRRAALAIIAAGGAAIVTTRQRALAAASALHARRYLVFVDGRRSGTYDIEFVPRDHGFTAIAAMSIRVDVAFITAYRFQQDSQEDWHQGRLVGFEYVTNDNGKLSLVSGIRDGDTLQVKGPEGPTSVPGDALLCGFWNGDILLSRHLINPQTAALTPLTVRDLGVRSEKVAKTAVHGDAFAVKTFIDGTIWFDAERQFLASSFVQDGHKVEIRRA
jgi:Family of unknown function (DUF6134)